MHASGDAQHASAVHSSEGVASAATPDQSAATPALGGLAAGHISAAAQADLAAGDSNPAEEMPPSGVRQEADMEVAGYEQPDSSQGGQLQKRVPQWRIIRPQRCKYRHMVDDPYDEVEVGV